MSSSIKSKKTQILLISFAFTFIIFILNKNPSKSLPNLPFNLRNLLSGEDVTKRCEKAPKDFLNKYNATTELPPVEEIKLSDLSDSQLMLKGIIEGEKVNFNTIKKYIPKILIFFIFLIVDVFFIIMWFVFCGCCCCCGKRNKPFAGGCAKFLFFLFCFFSVISILICVIGFIVSPSIYKSINGVLCSLYKVVFHLIEGVNGEIPISDWKGLDGINDLILKYKKSEQNIKDLPKIEDDSLQTECSSQNAYCQTYKEILESLQTALSSSSPKLDPFEDKITSFSSEFTSIKDKTFDSVENIMQKIDDYYKLAIIILFAALAGLCLLGMLTLVPYFCCNYGCISCLFHLFWNIQMLLIIITVLIAICLGVVGIVCKDAISLLNYSVSSKNLENEKPFLLDFLGEHKDKIDICFNKNGDISSLFISDDLHNADIKEKSDEFKANYTDIKDKNDFKQKVNLAKAYEQLDKEIDVIIELNNNLKTEQLSSILNCQFMRVDYDIITKEINDCLAKTLVLFSIIIIISDLAAFVSILFGLLFVINYKGQNDFEEVKSHERNNKSQSRDTKNKMDSSSENLRK